MATVLTQAENQGLKARMPKCWAYASKLLPKLAQKMLKNGRALFRLISSCSQIQRTRRFRFKLTLGEAEAELSLFLLC